MAIGETSLGTPDRSDSGGLPGPTSGAERIVAIDVLRGVALLGIVFMNIPFAGLPAGVGWNPAAAGGKTGADWWAWFLSSVLVDGKARALFSMLFGAGVMMMWQRAERAGAEGRAIAADLHYRRMLWLMVFGLVDSYLLLWTGDIIWIYGLCGLVLYPLRNLSTRALIGAGLALIAVTVVYGMVERAGEIEKLREVQAIRSTLAAEGPLTEKQQETLDAWNEETEDDLPTPERIEEALETARGGYLRNVVANAGTMQDFHSKPLYMETDALSMMLIGMGLLRARVITGERRTRVYALMAAVGLPLGCGMQGLTALEWSRSGFDLEHFGPWWLAWEWVYPAQRLLTALGHVGLVMLVCRAGVLRPVLSATAAAGRMPLTNYLGQSVIYLLLFTGAGFAMIGEFRRHELMVIAGAIWVFQAVVSVVWLRAHGFGPAEYVWRWLTYGRRPEGRRK